jgi:NADH:ubiquinone oxidoreductase subunit 5 (subunit L)/multisubunit Na+/H+ antiporter MnhA subunit
MTWIAQNLWLIPVLPLVASGVIAINKQPQRKLAVTLSIGSMVLAFLLSLCAFSATLIHHGESGVFREVAGFNWLQFGGQWLQLGWVLDPLTAIMLVMVSFVSLLIFIFSVGYMAHDENFMRFFCFMSLFAAAMLGVVIANNLLLFFVCWELVGLTSYLLIGFWYHKPSAAAAAKKAFITTRIGDLGLLLGMVWLYAETSTLNFYANGLGCLEQSALTTMVTHMTAAGMAVSTAIGLLIFLGAVGKSGQLPLHVWLPDAMEGPTPVSALIHAATMVAAGVFLVARVYPLMSATSEQLAAADTTRFSKPAVVASAERTLTPALSLSERERENHRQPVGESNPGAMSDGVQKTEGRTTTHPLPGGEGRGEGQRNIETPASPVSFVLKVITWIGALTAIFAASIAVAQTDIKRILAYSTVSQLGYMMLGLGVGGVAVGMFHLITHAFFKALLFLGSGSVIHGCHEEQDVRKMGGLKKFMPVTFATYAIGMLALAGFPLFFSGFWSKDEILHAAHGWPMSHIPFYLGCIGALLTAFYMTRQVALVFFGSYRSSRREEAHSSPNAAHSKSEPPHVGSYEEKGAPHESPAVMTVPLVILAAFAILLGFVGTPAWPWFDGFLKGEPAGFNLNRLTESGTLGLMLASAVIVFAGLGLGWWFYGKRQRQTAEEPDALQVMQPAVFRLLENKYFVDEIYDATVVRFNAWAARICDFLDRWIWGGAVLLVSYVMLGLSWLYRFTDEFVVDLGFDTGCETLREGGDELSSWHSGRVQTYLRVIGVALVVLVLFLIWGRKA